MIRAKLLGVAFGLAVVSGQAGASQIDAPMRQWSQEAIDAVVVAAKVKLNSPIAESAEYLRYVMNSPKPTMQLGERQYPIEFLAPKSVRYPPPMPAPAKLGGDMACWAHAAVNAIGARGDRDIAIAASVAGATIGRECVWENPRPKAVPKPPKK